MKKLYCLAIIALITFTGFSQSYYMPQFYAYGNPGGAETDTIEEYPSGSGLSPLWTTVLTGSNSTTKWSSTLTLPFAFSFNGNAVTDYLVGSCGMLTFSTSTSLTPSYTNAKLPSSSVPDNTICAWGIQGSGSNDYVVSRTFGSSPNRQQWLMFSSYAVSASTSCYTYWAIVLEETTNNIYIVDMRSAGSSCVAEMTIGIQLSSSSAIQIADAPNTAQLATSDATVEGNVYYEFNYGSAPTYDIQALSVTTSAFQILSQAPFTVEGQLANLGSQAITSFDINFSDGVGGVVTSSVGSVSIDPLETYNFTSSTGWTPSTSDNYDLKVWASNINGNADENMSNDTAVVEIAVMDTFVPRVPMHEGFTSSTCGPCVAGNQNLSDVLSNYDKGEFSLVKYQMDWPGSGDPYFTDEGGERQSYYSITSVPHLVVDGGSFDDNTSSYDQTYFDEIAAQPSFMGIEAYYTVSGQTVDMNISITPLADYSQTDNIMHIAIVEDTTYMNTATNGETEFYSVMKKMVPDADGTSLGALSEGVAKTFNESYTFEGSYNANTTASNPVDHDVEHTVEDFGRLFVVVWVQDKSSKEVHQSATAVDTTGSQSSITDLQVNGSGIVSLYPNPSSSVSNLKYYNSVKSDVTFKLHNMIGEAVYSMNVADVSVGSHSFRFNTADLADGIYTAQLVIGEYIYTTKVVVSK